MNKKLTKIVGVTLGLSMAVGVGAGIAATSNKQATRLYADETVSFAPSDFSGQGTSGTGSAVSATKDSVTFACDKGYGTTQLRCYSGGKITISSTNTITSVSFTFSGSYTGGLNASYSSLSSTSWEKSLTSQARITACDVTYSTGGAQTYSITYDKNTTDSVTGMPSDSTGLEPGTYNLSNAVPERENYTFGGWAATSESKTPITSVTISDGSKTVYAIWVEPVVSGTFNKYSGELTEGDYILTYGSVAMGNTVVSSKIQNASLSFTAGADSITNPVQSAVYKIESVDVSGTTYWTLKNEAVNKYIQGATSTNMTLSTGASNDSNKYKVTESSNTYNFLCKATEGENTKRYIRAYNSVWGSYASSNGGPLTLYKKFIAATGISLNNDELLLGVGSEGNLVATLTPSGASSSVTWSSSDEDVATVDQNGVVTGVGAGSATITARVSELVYAECDVTVTAASIPATSVSLDKNSGSLIEGQNITLTATVLPENTTDSITWSSSDEDVATVSGGVVTAVGAGTATITVSAGEKHADFALTVQGLNALTVYEGANIDAVGKLMFKNGKTAIIDDGTGAFWAYATANVTQNVGDIVRVQGAVVNYNNRGGLEVNNASITSVSGTITPSAPVQLNESEALAYISSFGENTANTVPHRRVSMRTGVVGGEGNFLTWTWPEGTALMETNISKGSMEAGKVYDIDGYLINFYKSGSDTYLCICIINAEEPEVAPESISLNKSELKLDAGNNSTLVATLNPSGASGNVSWVSSQEAVAEVDDGVVTAISAGSAIVTAFIDANGNGSVDAGEIKAECSVVVSRPTRSLNKQSITANLTSTMSVDNDEFTIDGAMKKETGYYQDGTADTGTQRYVVIKSDSPMFAIAPLSITFTARLGGGSNKTLGNPIKACFVDSNGDEIDSTIVTVAGAVTTTPRDYVVSLPYSADAYGVKLMHNKEASFNARYYSFNVSYSFAESTATLLGNETGSGVDSVKMKFSAKISVASWASLGTVTDYGIMMFKRKASGSAYSGTNTPVRDAFRNNETLTVSHKGSGVISADGDYYIFSAKANVNDPSNYGVVVCAAPFIVVNGTYYFLDEMEYSVNTLAQYHLANGGSSLSEDALNSLKGA